MASSFLTQITIRYVRRRA